MTETELEEFIGKAIYIALHPGSYSIFTQPELLGQISLRFPKDCADELVQFSKYFREELSHYNKKVNINQVSEDKIDLTIMVEKEPAIILSVKGLDCRNTGVSWFFKKQPINKPLLLFPALNEDLSTMMHMVDLDPDRQAHQPIFIIFWRGKPFGS